MIYFLPMLGAGIFWSLTYILIIRRSFLDRSYGMPMVALCANISWEFIFSFVFAPDHVSQRVINITWFLLDTVILFQFLRYGRSEVDNPPKLTFYLTFAYALLTSFCVVLLMTVTLHDYGTYSAFGGNLLMSVLFIVMLYRRRTLRGQSLGIALCKLLGTALASLAFLIAPFAIHSPLLLFLCISTFVYDGMYVVMVFMAQRNDSWLIKLSQAKKSDPAVR
jgi:hypothetical protein